MEMWGQPLEDTEHEFGAFLGQCRDDQCGADEIEAGMCGKQTEGVWLFPSGVTESLRLQNGKIKWDLWYLPCSFTSVTKHYWFWESCIIGGRSPRDQRAWPSHLTSEEISPKGQEAWVSQSLSSRARGAGRPFWSGPEPELLFLGLVSHQEFWRRV